MTITHVLHVVDRVTGGVPTAVRTYIQNSPSGIQHTVLTPFIAGEPADIWSDANCKLLDLGSGHLRRLRRIHRTVSTLRPTTVHAHSSFAGAYSRLAVRSQGDRRIVYSPHCFAFERRDLSLLLRRIYRSLERLMMSNTSLVAACSAQEARVARRLAPSARGRVTHIPNIASVRPGVAHLWSLGELKIGMIGRISPQKDPAMFVGLSSELKARNAQVKMVWLGDGDRVGTQSLEKSGIHVTGWLPADELRTQLLGLHAYLHCAAWEGFPIAVLDAYASGLPILVRNISAFDDVPTHLTFDGGFADFLNATTTPDSFARWAKSNHADWSVFLACNTARKQTETLTQVWIGDHA